VADATRPVAAELRAVAQPPAILGRSMHEHWAGLLYMRRLSIHVTRLLAPTRATPDGVTVAMGLCGVAAALVVTVPALWAAFAALALVQLQLLLDCCDGELARWRGTTGSVRGVYIDGLAHTVTDALLIAAVGVHADGGLGSLGGWTTAGLVAAVLCLLVHAETDLVHVARAKTGLPLLEPAAVVPAAGVVRRLRRALGMLRVNRLLSAWDLVFVVVVAAIADRVSGTLGGTRLLTVVLVAVGCLVAVGHLISVLTSRRLR